jgi:competence protein ComGC
MEQNPTPPSLASPRTSPAAIWSLILGILGLTCFAFFTGVPAVICGHIAQARIKRSGGLLGGSGLALAGLITGYISIVLGLLVIPLLLSIAVPNFVKAREVAKQNACINNLRQLEGAVEMWALDNKKLEDSRVTLQDISPYVKQPLACPSGGTYRLGRVNEKPTCTIPGHLLPASDSR